MMERFLGQRERERERETQNWYMVGKHEKRKKSVGIASILISWAWHIIPRCNQKNQKNKKIRDIWYITEECL